MGALIFAPPASAGAHLMFRGPAPSALTRPTDPAGGVTLRLAKGDAVIDRLAALGQLNATAAAAAKTLLAFASLSATDGRAAAPVTLTDGEAAIAGFTLGPLQPVCACE